MYCVLLDVQSFFGRTVLGLLLVVRSLNINQSPVPQIARKAVKTCADSHAELLSEMHSLQLEVVGRLNTLKVLSKEVSRHLKI